MIDSTAQSAATSSSHRLCDSYVFFKSWEGPRASWERYRVTAEECPRITEAFLEEERRVLPSWVCRQEYECSFEELEDQVFTLDMVESAVTSEVTPLFGGAFS